MKESVKNLFFGSAVMTAIAVFFAVMGTSNVRRFKRELKVVAVHNLMQQGVQFS